MEKFSPLDVAHDEKYLTSGSSTDSWFGDECSAASRFCISKQDTGLNHSCSVLYGSGGRECTSVAGDWVALSLSASVEGVLGFCRLYRIPNFSHQLRTEHSPLNKIVVMDFLHSITLRKFVFGLQATSLLWNHWLPSDINVREHYAARARQDLPDRAGAAAYGNPILAAQFAVMSKEQSRRRGAAADVATWADFCPSQEAQNDVDCFFSGEICSGNIWKSVCRMLRTRSS